MAIIEILVVLAVVGCLAGLAIKFLPMSEPFRVAAILILGLWVLIYVLEFFGLTNFGLARNDLIQLLVIILVLGVIVWFITKYLPMTPFVRQVVYIVAVIALIIISLEFLGLTNFRDGGGDLDRIGGWRNNRD
jgi:hypothetical protein